MTRALTLEDFIEANAVDVQVVRTGVAANMIVVFKVDPGNCTPALADGLKRIWRDATRGTAFEQVRCLLLPIGVTIETIYSE